MVITAGLTSQAGLADRPCLESSIFHEFYTIIVVREVNGFHFSLKMRQRLKFMATCAKADTMWMFPHSDQFVFTEGSVVNSQSDAGRRSAGQPSQCPVVVVLLTFMCFLSLSAAQAQQARQDPFALGVRDTEPLSPEEQLLTFQLPPGFAIELVVAEPAIAKPMNLAFDERGRLWVSSSVEYPFAAAADAIPRDTITVLEDTNGDGQFDSVTPFADGLNIPIGLCPFQDGIICFSIPNILFLRDTTGDGIADTREVLYGPFDTTRDTHGMCNAFRRGVDGWIYACHGFNNRSEVAGRDGNKVVMHSGNTFRFRPDGSRIEHFTIGQVNPFGMAIDRFGDIFTADCHTRPVTLLLQGGNYDSFGRPHDGLGYVPNVMEHLHGSTAIAGIALGEHTNFPPEYQDSSFGGNVMTSRINRNRLVRTGAGVKAVEQPDLCSSTDPWFRPVDLIPGPDGALYVADFYNRIIGHYEVDLYHPGRDRFRGRVWRISWQDAGSPGKVPDRFDIGGLSAAELIDRLRSASPPQALLLANQVADEFPVDAIPLLRTAVTESSPELRVRSLQLLQRLKQLNLPTLVNTAADDVELVRVHAYRALNELPADKLSSVSVSELLRHGFADPSAMVRRAAVLAASRHPTQSNVPDLIRLAHHTPAEDVHLLHSIRMAVRDHLKNDQWFDDIAASAADDDIPFLAQICLALRTARAGEYIAARVPELSSSVPQRLPELLQFAAGYVSVASASEVTIAIRHQFRDQQDVQLQLLNAMKDGFSQRRQPIPESVTDWAQQMAMTLLRMSSPKDLEALHVPPSLGWRYRPHPDSPHPDNPWVVSTARHTTDGQRNVPLFSSIDHGEQRTGILRSDAFSLTDRLQFYLAGHDGPPDRPARNRNFVRLLDAASEQVLLQAVPPRSDAAHPVRWDTSGWQGTQAVMELVDGDTGSAFAWLAAGLFSDVRLNPTNDDHRRQQAAALIADFQLTSLRPVLAVLAASRQLDRSQRAVMTTSLARFERDTRLMAAAMIPQIFGADDAVVDLAIKAIVKRDPVVAAAALDTACQVATSPEQLRIAEQLCSDAAGAEFFLQLVESGRLSAMLLQRPTIRQRLSAIAGSELHERITQLTASLPEEDAATERRMAELRSSYQQHAGDPEAGGLLFRKNCNVCHQVAGEGKKVGPNLDGVGTRGLDRLAEDLLAPNRNVDIAFRTTTVVTTEGRAFSGLLRELEDDRVSIVDGEGKETLLTTDQIDERIGSSLSPMPVNFVETLSDQQLRDLMAYLLSLRH